MPYKLEESYEAWQIIKKLTNHNSLKNVNDISEKDLIGVNFRGKLY